MEKTIVLQPEKCLGCRTCELICSFSRAKEFNPQKSAVSVISYDAAMLCVPIMCTQCEDAACAAICPVKAIARDEWGAMKIDEKKSSHVRHPRHFSDVYKRQQERWAEDE